MSRMTKTTVSRLTGLGAALLCAGIVPAARAQAPAETDVMARAREIVAQIEDAYAEGCDLSLHGAPQRAELTERWLVAYSGVGPACDDAGAALQRDGTPANIAFFRRPSADEILPAIAKMRASVRRGYDCLIGFRDEPRFDEESNIWTMRYYTSGHQCDDAAAELERQGRELRVSFQRSR
jgi:hypothetical protein